MNQRYQLNHSHDGAEHNVARAEDMLAIGKAAVQPSTSVASETTISASRAWSTLCSRSSVLAMRSMVFQERRASVKFLQRLDNHAHDPAVLVYRLNWVARVQRL